MFKIEVLDSNLDRFKEYSVLSLRIALGVIFVAHGSQKLFGLFGGGGIAGTLRYMDMLGFSYGAFFGIALALAEFFGGLFSLIGFFTRWAAFFIAIVMSVAIFAVHLKHGLFVSNEGFEFAGSLFCMAITLIINGGGKFSIDNLLFEKKKIKTSS